MARVLGFLIRYFSNYYTLHRSDLAARAAPLDPCLSLDTFEVQEVVKITSSICWFEKKCRVKKIVNLRRTFTQS